MLFIFKKTAERNRRTEFRSIILFVPFFFFLFIAMKKKEEKENLKKKKEKHAVEMDNHYTLRV